MREGELDMSSKKELKKEVFAEEYSVFYIGFKYDIYDDIEYTRIMINVEGKGDGEETRQ